MRKPEYRAWSKDENKMYYNAEYTYDFGAYYGVRISEPSFGCLIDNNEYILMQSTGLKDEENKSIFECDILSDGHNNYLVHYNKDKAKFMVDNFYDPCQDTPTDIFDECAYKSMKVIGNRFENPELLKEVE